MSFRVKSGSAYVDVDPDLKRYVDRAIQRASPTVVTALKVFGREIYDYAYKRWPVETGKSRKLLFHRVEVVSLERLELRVGDDAAYAFYIKEPWPGKSKIVTKLLTSPTRRKFAKLSDSMKDLLGTELEPAKVI